MILLTVLFSDGTVAVVVTDTAADGVVAKVFFLIYMPLLLFQLLMFLKGVNSILNMAFTQHLYTYSV